MFAKAQSSRVSLLVSLAALVCLGSARAQTGSPTNAQPVALVRGFKGAPSVQKGPRWFPVQRGELIAAGARVRTGVSDSLDIMLDEPGRIISLGASSAAIIDLTRSSVSLEAGELIATVRKTTRDNTSIIFRSRFGVATVRAADLKITVNPVPSIAVLDGSVDFEVARALDTAPALQLQADAYLVAGAENPIIQVMDATTRGFLVGRVDSLVSSQGALAEKFWPRPSFGACHTPTVTVMIDPEGRPGRIKGLATIDEYTRGAYALQTSADGAVYPAGSGGCPLHGRRVVAPEKAAPFMPVKMKSWDEE